MRAPVRSPLLGLTFAGSIALILGAVVGVVLAELRRAISR